MQEKRHDRVVEMRLCFFLGKVGDYNVSFVETRMCRSTVGKIEQRDYIGNLVKNGEMNITQKQLYDDYIKARKLGERG